MFVKKRITDGMLIDAGDVKGRKHDKEAKTNPTDLLRKSRWMAPVFVIVLVVWMFIFQIIQMKDTGANLFSLFDEDDRTKVVVPGPETFCPPFARNAGFTERITFIDVTGQDCLPWRSVCGIESTARANPEMDVFLYLNSEKSVESNGTRKRQPFQRPGHTPHCPATAVLNQLANIHVTREDLKSYFTTFRWREFVEQILGLDRTSPSFQDQFSTALKLALLYRYGGLHLDADVITFRPLHCLKNALTTYEFGTSITFRTKIHVAHQMLSFESNHPFIRWAIRTLFGNYRMDQDDFTPGPRGLTKMFQLYCNVTSQDHRGSLKVGVHRCHRGLDIDMIDSQRFFPIPHYLNIRYFRDSWTASDLSAARSSYLAHIDSSGWGIPVAPTSLYASLARTYCPSTWNVVRKTFGSRSVH